MERAGICISGDRYRNLYSVNHRFELVCSLELSCVRFSEIVKSSLHLRMVVCEHRLVLPFSNFVGCLVCLPCVSLVLPFHGCELFMNTLITALRSGHW